MDSLPILRPREPTGPLGYLNYPPEILNRLYQEVLVDDSQILAFLCSPDPAFRFIGLKQMADRHQSGSQGHLDWPNFYDTRYYVGGSGLSAHFLRVCKKIWLEGSPVLYGNLTIAVSTLLPTTHCFVLRVST